MPDQIVLIPSVDSGPEIQIVKRNGQWELSDVSQVAFQITIINPILSHDLNLTYMVLNNMDLEDLINTCQTDSRLQAICQSDEYWKNRLLSKFGDNLKGIFLSGSEHRPILDGQHSMQEYIDVERRLENTIDNMADEMHIVRLVEDVVRLRAIEHIDELMYIMRNIGNKKDLPDIFDELLFGVALWTSFYYGHYPIDYTKEYLSLGYVSHPYKFFSFTTGWEVYRDHDRYLEFLRAVLDTVRLPAEDVRAIYESSQNPRLISLVESYGYSADQL